MVVPVDLFTHDFISKLWHLEACVSIRSRIPAEEVKFLFIRVSFMVGD